MASGDGVYDHPGRHSLSLTPLACGRWRHFQLLGDLRIRRKASLDAVAPRHLFNQVFASRESLLLRATLRRAQTVIGSCAAGSGLSTAADELTVSA